MEAIGGNEPKFVGVAQSDEDAFTERKAHLLIMNPHGVTIGKLVVEAKDGKVHVTPSTDHEVDFVFHRGGSS
jgi:hypothetical protein